MWGFTLVSDLNARSMSMGYSLFMGAPSASRANSSSAPEPVLASARVRGPGNFSTFQNSAHDLGCVPPLNTWGLYTSTVAA